MSKIAQPTYTVLPNIAKRWSPRSFSDKRIPKEQLKKIIEAGTWAASCFNEQPWRFIIGIKDEGEGYSKIYNCLNEKNKKWAKLAPVLMISLGKRTFVKSGLPNRFNAYDTGQAVSLMAIQAISEDIFMHQMAGFDPVKVRKDFKIPEEYEVLAAIAIGKLGPPEQLEENFQIMEKRERTRKKVEEIAFENGWEKAL